MKREWRRTLGDGKMRKRITDTRYIEDLTGTRFYGEAGSGGHENRSDFRPNPIKAVVVLDDPYKEKNLGIKTMVTLTNGPVGKPCHQLPILIPGTWNYL